MKLRNVTMEVQLLDWKGRSAKNPARIVLALSDDKDLEFFEDLTTAKGKTAGQILQVGFIISPDDPQHGTAASMEPEKKKEKSPLCAEAAEWMKKGNTRMRPSVFAAMTCKESKYQDYIVWKLSGDKCDPVDFMKQLCDVKSRSEFDRDPEALKRFNKHIGYYRDFVNK